MDHLTMALPLEPTVLHITAVHPEHTAVPTMARQPTDLQAMVRLLMVVLVVNTAPHLMVAHPMAAPNTVHHHRMAHLNMVHLHTDRHMPAQLLLNLYASTLPSKDFGRYPIILRHSPCKRDYTNRPL